MTELDQRRAANKARCKSTREDRARLLLEYGAGGKNYRELGAARGVSHSTIGRWLDLAVQETRDGNETHAQSAAG